jgi:isoquinoline 1-oxidoreductase beta subunit
MPERIPDIDPSERKSAADYRYLGKQVMRRDIPAKTNGSEIYGIDIQVPGMAYAAVLRCPVEGDGPLSVDDVAAKAIDGVTDVVTLPYGVAVVGNSVEATQRGKRALNVTWTSDSPFRGRDVDTALSDYAETARDLSIDGVAWSTTGEPRKILESADEVLEALYTSDPAYHAQMEPLNATASVSEDGKSAELWVGTQTQSLTIIGAAEALDTEQQNITLHPMTMGGGFGRRSVLRQQYVDDALFVSRELKRPIKVIWSREDDLEAGQFRAPAAQFLRASFDDDGALEALQHRVAVPNHLPTMNRHRWEANKPIDVISMLGSENTTYDIPNHIAEHLATERPCRVVAWRGISTSYTKFAIESFIDELADARAIDPLEFRLQLCHKNPRMHKVLETVADLASWGGTIDDDRALGIAVSGYSRSLSAGIADISVDRATGIITVHNYYGAGDAGFIVSPRNARAQVIGSIVFGLSSSLIERITVKDGAVQETNFHQYRIMRMNELPNIEVRVPSTDNPPSGVGELGLAMVGPSIANALFRLTGKRVRHLPLTPAVVSQALNS